MLLSGDREVNARAAAAELGIHEAIGDLLPQDKVGFVAALTKQGHRVLMVGDGANDAPAPSAAAVGVAYRRPRRRDQRRGRRHRAPERRSGPDSPGGRHRSPDPPQARQSIGVGPGLLGGGDASSRRPHGIPPAIGALLQEAIDVAVILNALRVLRPGLSEQPAADPAGPALA
ncbi:MAG: HAD family hydrolase [Gemmatimonadales bacterium]